MLTQVENTGEQCGEVPGESVALGVKHGDTSPLIFVCGSAHYSRHACM